MNLSSLCRHLSEDIVLYIFEFDKNIVVRRGVVKIMHALDKQLYSESFKVLMKKPLPILGRTTRVMNRINNNNNHNNNNNNNNNHNNNNNNNNHNNTYTWCSVKLRLDSGGEHYIDYSSGPGGVTCTLTFWGGTSKESKVNGVRRFEKNVFQLPNHPLTACT